MALTTLERLDLSDQLDDLIERARVVKGLALLDINDQMDDIIVKLGGAATAAPESTAPVQPMVSGVPELVRDFLAGQFINQASGPFTDILGKLQPYLTGGQISLDDIRLHAANWIDKNINLAA